MAENRSKKVSMPLRPSLQWLRPAAVYIPGLYLWKMDTEAPGNAHLTFVEFDEKGVAWVHAWNGERTQKLVAPATKDSSKLFGPIPDDGTVKKYGWRRQIVLRAPLRERRGKT